MAPRSSLSKVTTASSASTTTPTTTTKPKGKAAASKKAQPQQTKSLLVTLKLDKAKLQAFPAGPSLATAEAASRVHSHSPRNSSPLAAGGVTPDEVAPSSPAAASVADSTATGADSGLAASAKPVVKRPRATGGAATKPGRKKQKLDGTGPTSGPATKLGPKSNQGAINAQLRALDRSGKPCKRWTKKGFTLKSFTGVEWHLPSWSTPAIDKSLSVETVTTPSENGSTSSSSNQDKPNVTSAPATVHTPVAVPIVVTPPEDTKMVDVASS